MSSLLLHPLRTLRDARRILRLEGARPSRRAVLRSWFALHSAGAAANAQPCSVRLGEWTVRGANQADLLDLFEEIFVDQRYRIALGRPDPVILDCGANVGLATLFFKLHYPAARLTSFEPAPACFELLRRNVADNGLSDVTLVQAA